MSDEQDKLKLSLEAPKLFGRKKKAAEPAASSEPAQPARPAARKPAPKPAPTPAPAPEPEAEAAPEVEVAPEVEETVATPLEEELRPASDPTAVLDAVAEPETVADTEPDVVEPEPEVVEPEPEVVEETEPEPEVVEDTEPEPVLVEETEPEPDVEATPEPEPVAEAPAPAPVEKPALEKPAAKPAATKPATKPAAKPATTKPAATKPAPKPVKVEPEPVSDADLEDAEIAALGTQAPLLTSYRAAAVTGLVVGAAMVVLTWLSLRGCEAVRGTSSCGGGPGFLLLVATFALCVLLGSQLLKTFQIPDPGSSSFLAVGLVAVVALLFLIDFLDNWSMLVVIPALSIGGYLASVWVTKTFVEPVDT
ncbi:MAG TPA: hypothetical protein VM575_02025 [Nocardioides sp.]|nr:hypothetical protein [Nocardioides sp.]